MNTALISLGVDILEIDRLRAVFLAHRHRFLDRIFTTSEQEYCLQFKDPAPHLAVRFCAKEAISKALGVGIGAMVAWKDLEVIHDKQKRPLVVVSNRIKQKFQNPQFLLSMSHCQAYATAFVVRTH